MKHCLGSWNSAARAGSVKPCNLFRYLLKTRSISSMGLELGFKIRSADKESYRCKTSTIVSYTPSSPWSPFKLSLNSLQLSDRYGLVNQINDIIRNHSALDPRNPLLLWSSPENRASAPQKTGRLSTCSPLFLVSAPPF